MTDPVRLVRLASRKLACAAIRTRTTLRLSRGASCAVLLFQLQKETDPCPGAMRPSPWGPLALAARVLLRHRQAEFDMSRQDPSSRRLMSHVISLFAFWRVTTSV